MGELQRTYRGKAAKEHEREELPFPTAKPVERAIVVASMGVPPDEQDDRTDQAEGGFPIHPGIVRRGSRPKRGAAALTTPRGPGGC